MRPLPKSIRSPAPSLTQYSARTVSGCSRQSQERPKSSPTSSSAVAAKIRSPFGSKPSRASDAIATAFAATCPFMSSAPRPQISPSRSSPDQGSNCQSAASASTVSVCESSSNRGPPPCPGIRATRLARSGTLA